MSSKEKLVKGPVALYEQMRLQIVCLIEERNLNAHDPVPSEVELARLFGVSTRTSKEALILLEKEGVVYRLPRRGTFLSEKPESKKKEKQQFLAIVVPEIDDYVGKVIAAAAVQGLDSGYELLIRLSGGDHEREEKILKELAEGSVAAGIILFPGDRKTAGNEVLRLHLNNYPIVIVDRAFKEIELPSVYHDHYQGAYDIMKFLIEKGHKDIGFISEEIAGVMSREERYHGYIQALIDHKIPIRVNQVITKIESRWRNGKNEQLLVKYENFINDNPDMTAVFCSNDYVAMDTMTVAYKLGKRIPDELSIVGFTDFPIAGLTPIPLTTVRKSADLLGSIAIRLIEERIREPNKESRIVKLDTEIVERSSVRNIR